MTGVSHLTSEIHGGVALLGLHRPDRANAYHQPMLLELRHELGRLAEVAHALVLHAGVCRHFCSGADRAELDHRKPEDALDLLSRAVFAELAAWPGATVAAVRGAALGGGLELALACDLRVAGSDARFGFPETSLGLIPAAGGTLRAPALLGPGVAREMILFGRELGASEALALGLVSEVADPSAVLERAVDWASRAAARDPLTLRLAKEALATPALEGVAQAVLYGRRQAP